MPRGARTPSSLQIALGLAHERPAFDDICELVRRAADAHIDMSSCDIPEEAWGKFKTALERAQAQNYFTAGPQPSMDKPLRAHLKQYIYNKRARARRSTDKPPGKRAGDRRHASHTRTSSQISTPATPSTLPAASLSIRPQPEASGPSTYGQSREPLALHPRAERDVIPINVDSQVASEAVIDHPSNGRLRRLLASCRPSLIHILPYMGRVKINNDDDLDRLILQPPHKLMAKVDRWLSKGLVPITNVESHELYSRLLQCHHRRIM